jgi:hypothetical protein
MSQLFYELLKQCTVKLFLPNASDWGTGFFVAKNTILTCAHVVAGHEDQPIQVQWQEANLGIAVLKSKTETADLALLHCDLSSLLDHPPCPKLDEEFKPFHRLYIYGYPDDFPEGAGVTVQCEGDATDKGSRLIKFQSGQIRPGQSGSPVLNEQTGKVCGVVSDTRGRATDLGGLAVPMAEVAKYFPELQLWNKQFHEESNCKVLQQMVVNPFEGQAAIESLAYHIGRDELLRQIFEELEKGSNRSLVGVTQVGKTWLLKEICRRGRLKIERHIDEFIYLDMRCVEDGKDFFEALCIKLKVDPSLRGPRLNWALEGKRYILCLDEIDQLADDVRFTRTERDQLCSLCDGEDMPLSLVIASQASLITLFPDSSIRSSPLAGICSQIDVEPITYFQVQKFLTNSLEGTGVSFGEENLQEIYKDCQGKPRSLLDCASKHYRRIMGGN